MRIVLVKRSPTRYQDEHKCDTAPCKATIKLQYADRCLKGMVSSAQSLAPHNLHHSRRLRSDRKQISRANILTICE